MRFLPTVLFLITSRAEAFRIETTATPGCHERITLAASKAAGFPRVADAPAPTVDQHRAILGQVEREDVWTMTLVIGVRSNDLGAASSTDLASLAQVHDDPRTQQAHCLRREQDDGESGDTAAIAACRDFILGELAAGGLLDDPIDTSKQEAVTVALAVRGTVTIQLPRFAYHLGRALHAVEDSYTHAMRDPDGGRIRSVLDWIDWVGTHYDEARDGYRHIAALDDCTSGTTLENLRVQRATDAATSLISAIAAHQPIDPVLDQILAYEPGCTIANQYCNAPELGEASGSCAAVHPGLLVALAALVLLRRRAALVLVLLVGTAHADVAWHADARVGGSIDHAALAPALGGGADLGRLGLGAMIEWNPWLSLDVARGHPGALDAYGQVSWRWYKSAELALFSQGELGTSTILFDLVGIDQYSTGLYVGATLLGVSLPAGDRWRIIIDPSHFAVPIPQLSIVPFAYTQYRVDVGVEYQL